MGNLQGRNKVFNFITLDGCIAGPNGDISWYRHGTEENANAAESLEAGSILLFGRVTYQMMASYWPTPIALQNDPSVARGMNDAEKIVFPRTLEKADWKNTRNFENNLEGETQKLKQRIEPICVRS